MTGTHVHSHSDDHGHSHHHDVAEGGLRGIARAIFRPHSHDPADTIDTALEASARGITAVRISFTGLMVTAVLQLAVVVVTGSVALLADTIHNFSDALTAVPLFIAFRISTRPANRRYTYGYRRAEDLAGLFVIAMITLSSVVALWQAIDRLVNPRPLHQLGVLFVAGVIGFAGNELVALYRIREGTAIGSAALVADGHHARTDGFTSLAVAAGAIGVWAGFERADAIVGIGISIAIFAVLLAAARQIWYRLMDAVEPAVIDRIEEAALGLEGVTAIHSVHARWLGHRLAAELSVAVDGDIPVREGHTIAANLSHRLLHSVPHLDEAHVHIDPAGEAAHDHTHRH